MNKLDTHKEYVRGQYKNSLAASVAVTKKIASGEYPLVDVPCFCGAHDDELLTEHERYGIPARIVLCKNCALIRINPRMTQEAYTAFYNDHYRQLNAPRIFTFDVSSDEEAETAMFARQKQKGEGIIRQMVDQAIPAPKKVLDIGCHLGGMLIPFKERFDSELWGVEIDKKCADKAFENGVAVVSSVDELLVKDVKFDFIIMRDIIEHYPDLNEVRKVRELLAPDGFLFIFTPGMFRQNIHGNLQIAHTFYFCANTLHWVLVQLGFRVTFIDEECFAFCQKETENILKGAPPTDWVEYVRDEFEGKELRKMPPFSGVCKFTKEELYDNMQRTFEKKFPDLYEISQSQSGAVCIIAGGPSIDGEVDNIRALKDKGAKVISILRMYPWCVKHGIVPDYVVSLDCSEDQAHGFDAKVQGVTYLFASVTNPSFFERVDGEKVYIFDSRDDRKIQDFRRAAGYTTCSVVNGGGSVAICSISLAFNLGFRDLHIFGLDCMVSSETKTHADDIAGTSLQIRYLPVEIDGKTVLTSGSWLEFANQALDLISVGKQEGALDSVKVYGESLINKLWDGTWEEEMQDVESA